MRNYTEIVAAKLNGRLSTDVQAIRAMRLAGQRVTLIGRSQAAELCPQLAAAPALLVIDGGTEYWAQKEACGPAAAAARSDPATPAESGVALRPSRQRGRRLFPYTVAGSVLLALGVLAQHAFF